MEKERDSLGRFKLTGLLPKKRVRTEYNRAYHKKTMDDPKAHENRLESARKSWKKHQKARQKNNLDWSIQNKERSLAIKKKYRDSHKEESAQYRRKWLINNREKARHNVQRRYARRKGAEGSHSLEEWKALKSLVNFKCLSCFKSEPDIKLTKDHVIPLILGGTDFISNIQPLCLSCNCKKSAKIVDYRVNI